MAVIALAAMGVVSSLFTTAGVDEVMRERTAALRAVSARLERIQAFDYGQDIQNLVDHLALPDQRVFRMEHLAPPSVADIPQNLAGFIPVAGTVPHGYVSVDATDILRVAITIDIHWTSRSGDARHLQIPITLTETE